ncbi:hypothetical protein ACTXT7_006810 [Hymenolepis weldensis]
MTGNEERSASPAIFTNYMCETMGSIFDGMLPAGRHGHAHPDVIFLVDTDVAGFYHTSNTAEQLLVRSLTQLPPT